MSSPIPGRRDRAPEQRVNMMKTSEHDEDVDQLLPRASKHNCVTGIGSGDGGSAEMTNSSNSTVALNWIDGAWVGAEQVRESINPATYEVIGAYADGGLEAAREGIAAAKRVFQTSVWAIDHELRARGIGQIADAFERHRDSLLDLLAAENGKVKGEAGKECSAEHDAGDECHHPFLKQPRRSSTPAS